MFDRFPFYQQLDLMDCGPSCLRMIAKWHGKNVPIQYLRDMSCITREGVSLTGISQAAENLGFRTVAAKIRFETEDELPGLIDFPMPCIAHWEQKHFVVIYRINTEFVWIADPAYGKTKMKRSKFEQSWCSDRDKGIVLGLECAPAFYNTEIELESENFNLWSFLFSYTKPYRRLIIQFFLGILATLIFQVLFPFLTQSIIDIGVLNKNIGFLWLVLAAQLMLFSSQYAVSFIQSWILLQVGKRVNTSLVSDFLAKMIRLPISFFDSKNSGDLFQRINDNYRVDQFLTNSALNVFFSFFSVLILSCILFYYSPQIFLVFAGFSLLYFSWIWLFLKRRRELDYRTFQASAENQQNVLELIHGMQEIKLQGSERKRRWKWVAVQAKLFRIETQSLSLRQVQEFGANFFAKFKDIIIIFLAAQSVIAGEMTLGMMLAIQYIVGQLNAPFEQFIQFIRSAQDARISIERMREVAVLEDEEDRNVMAPARFDLQQDIVLNNVSFQYTAIGSHILKNINLTIPHGKVTAIVGSSGSGKTTLLKLLLGFYRPVSGSITLGSQQLDLLNRQYWRSVCGTVMQDGFIFSDTIANNIAESDEQLDHSRLQKAIDVANLREMVDLLPLSFNTKVGSLGNGISQGQRQRLLIARAVYKNPEFLFFDEATNALDAINEHMIMKNLHRFFQNKTVVIVAHRLSTVINADQIIVLDRGMVAEQGTHAELLKKRGKYAALVSNQLNLEQLNGSHLAAANHA